MSAAVKVRRDLHHHQRIVAAFMRDVTLSIRVSQGHVEARQLWQRCVHEGQH
jgi:hypothetical protein